MGIRAELTSELSLYSGLNRRQTPVYINYTSRDKYATMYIAKFLRGLELAHTEQELMLGNNHKHSDQKYIIMNKLCTKLTKYTLFFDARVLLDLRWLTDSSIN